MVYHFVFDELAELLASMDPNKVLAFRTSEKSQSRLNELLEKHKQANKLSKEEESEVEQLLLLDHIVGLAKARALNRLANKHAS